MARLALLFLLTLGMSGVAAPATAAGTAGYAVSVLTTDATYGWSTAVGVGVSQDGQPATGTIQVAIGDAVVASEPLDPDGTAQLRVDGARLVPGSMTLELQYLGDGTEPIWTTPITVQVERRWPPAPTLTVTRTPGPTSRGQAMVVVRPPSEWLLVPSGNVIVRMQGEHTVKRVKRALTDGAVELTLPRLRRGPWDLKARYVGDAYYKRRTSAPLTIRIR